MKTHCEKVIEILERDGEISNYHCIENKITYRLAARIQDLKGKGWQFKPYRTDDGNWHYKVLYQPTDQGVLFTNN